MKLSFKYAWFPGAGKNHFLLESGTLQLKLVFDDNSEMFVNVPREADASRGFMLNLPPESLPYAPATGGAPPAKKRVVKIRCQYSNLLSALSKQYELLRIVQWFTCTPRKDYTDVDPRYSLAPLGWENATGALKTANMATHPLANLDELGADAVKFNVVAVDLTELWFDLHAGNFQYTNYHPLFSKTSKVKLKVFGNLSGNSFIWYACIPAYLAGMDSVSPHVFFAPIDN